MDYASSDDDIYSHSQPRRRVHAHRSASAASAHRFGVLGLVANVRLAVPWQPWLRSEACRMCVALVAVGVMLFVVHISSYERAILIELAEIDPFVTALGDEHARARVLDVPVYFINAEGDAPQRRAIEERLARLRPPAMGRIQSVDGALHLDEDRAHGFPGQSAYELGRTLSHLAAARQLMLDGHDAALVVEDSAHLGLAPRWPFRLSELLAQLPATWTTLQLYHTADVWHAPGAVPSEPALTVVPYGGAHMGGTVAYVLSRRGADALMRATRAGRAVHRVALATRNGRTDTILFEFPHAEPWAIWPRYVFAHPRASDHSFGAHIGARRGLREARLARAIVEHARAAWPPFRPGPSPDDDDSDDAVDANALLVMGDVLAADG
ncbi:hypothetical protein KFE25_009945 [Diacronema lutheri]|uniref:Glycosyltransferase family 25 protein n=1 Tax=Diacronema lutheri TaxID=2081491 RepID=A0A8J5XI69_DIALT|nr:hypothetical protein KFE25_009945 [Diacronema lutheri]